MNTQLQIKHPITKIIINLNLITKQIRITQNKTLNYTQKNLQQHKHTIKYQIYTKNPINHLPKTNIIETLIVPKNPNIQHNSNIYPK